MIKKLIAPIISAVVVIGIIVAVLILNNPKFVFNQSIEGALKGLSKRSEFSTLSKASDTGSIELEATIDDEQLIGEGNEVSFGGKFYFESGKKIEDMASYAENLNFKISQDGEEAGFKANAYFSTEYMYIADCNLLDGTYGLVRGDLKDEFMDSEWVDELLLNVPNSDELKDAIGNVLGYIDDKKEQALMEEAADKLDEYTKLMKKLLSEYAEFEMEVKKVDCGDERVKSRVVTMTLDQDAVAAMLEELIATLREDDELRDLVMDNAEELISLIEDYLKIMDEDFDLDDMLEDLEDGYDELFSKEDWKAYIYGLKTQEFTVEIQVAAAMFTPTLRQVVVALEQNGDYNEIILNLGAEGVKKSNHFSIEVDGAVLLAYEISEDTKDMYKSELSVPLYNPEKGRNVMSAVATLEVNRAKSKYTLTLINTTYESDFNMDTFQDEYYTYEDKIVVTGKLADDGKTIRLTLDQVKFLYDDDEVENESYSFDISVTINMKDKMPDVKASSKVTSIFEMDEDDFEEFMENAEEEFEYFIGGSTADKEGAADDSWNGGFGENVEIEMGDDWGW